MKLWQLSWAMLLLQESAGIETAAGQAPTVKTASAAGLRATYPCKLLLCQIEQGRGDEFVQCVARLGSFRCVLAWMAYDWCW